MALAKTTIEVLGETIEVQVLGSLAFEATYADEKVRENSREKLEAALAKLVRENRVEAAIPVLLDHGGRYVRALLRRKHASRRGAYLFAIADRSETIDGPRIEALGASVTDEEVAELNRLREAESAAQRDHLKLRHEVNRRDGRVGPEQLIAKAAEAAQSTAADAAR